MGTRVKVKDYEYIWDDNPVYLLTVVAAEEGRFLVEVFDSENMVSLATHLLETRAQAMSLAYRLRQEYEDKYLELRH